MSDLRKSLEAMIEAATIVEQENGYHWANKRKMPASDIAYEWGVKAGIGLGAHFLLDDLLQCVEALEKTVNQRTRGYPTPQEWEANWIVCNTTLSQLKEKWGL
jgi:hypothetical protein